MYARFFQRTTRHTFPKINYSISRSHHQDKPSLPKWELAELFFTGIFGFYILISKIKEDKNNRIAAPKLEEKAQKPK